MQFWIIQTLNSLALGGLLFLLAAGFSLIFGLMRIANLTHGSLFMLGAYLGVSVLGIVPNLWLAALLAALAVAFCGGLLERLLLRPLAGKPLGQVLVTLGISFIVADLCLMIWGGDPIPLAAPASLQRPLFVGGIAFPAYRGLDADMLPLALIVVILGGVGSLLGAFVGSFITAAIYTFGSALLPDLAYVILFLPMIVVIAFRPRGLFGRSGA